MGDIEVPRDALWRAQTQRAVENFPISGTTLEPAHIVAMARVKKCRGAGQRRARHHQRGAGDGDRCRAPTRSSAATTTTPSRIDVFQTGSGTSSNMNMNEVLASLASRAGVDGHPNDHVNASQSSNDTFPTSIHVAARARPPAATWCPRSTHLASALEAKAEEFKDVVKSGRTHLMDATPVMLGQEFGGYAAIVRLGIERLESTLPRVAELPLGGTAVGTGINTPDGFAERVIADLAAETGLPFTEARNHFEAQGGQDALVELSGQLRTIAVGPHQDLQRPALDVLGPDAPAWPRSTCPTCSRGRASCPARSTRCSPRPR